MDLPRMLPTREMDHTIDLNPNAKPIVKLHIIIPIWKTKIGTSNDLLEKDT